MKQLFILGFMFLLFASSVVAVDCQYTKEVISSTDTKFMPYDDAGNQLDELLIEFSDRWNQPATIINPNSVDLEVVLKMNLNIRSKQWCNGYAHPLDFIRTNELKIPANSYIELPTEKPVTNHYCDEFKWTELVEVQYNETDQVEVKLTTIENKVLVCDGKDDGSSCNSPNECGGGFCVEGHCSNTEHCFNNDCQCAPDEIQCVNNKQCVEKGVVPLDVKPKCGMDQECLSGYLNSESGLCAKSPAQINTENEENRELYLFLGIGFTILCVIGIFTVLYYRHKSKKLDVAKIEAKYRKIQYEIERKNEEIEELKAKTHRTKEDSKRLKALSTELTEQMSQFEKTSKNFFLKKYGERYGSKIYLDTDSEYIRFKSNNEFLHRYIYRSFYGTFDAANEIHHIDANHYNNEIWNLIEVSPEQHRRIKHAKILYGDWVSGINELRRIGLSENDFPPEVVKKLKEE